MAKRVDLVRKDCLINNLEVSPKITITVDDIEHEIKKCPRGQRIFDYGKNININKKCFISDLNRKVGMYNTNYGDISNVINNCKIYRREAFGNSSLTTIRQCVLIGILLFILISVFSQKL